MCTHLSDQEIKRVAVCMSGGLDSAFAASLLIDKGYDVVGLTACMLENESCGNQADAATRARKAAEFLGIPHYTVNLSKEFSQKIIEPFLAEYARGRTPSPCINCNQIIKFGLLLDYATQMGCSHTATGHYARVEKQDGQWHLLKGVDEHKDQSYFLHRLEQRQLARALFPLGYWKKDNVAQYARERGIPALSTPESQDLCFVNDSDYAVFLEQHSPDLKKSGPILDTSGRLLGQHRGFYHYTIGQREGIGIASGKRLYVTAIDAASNTVVLGSRDEVMSHGCIVKDINWIGSVPADGTACQIRLRYKHKGTASFIHFLPDGSVQGTFSSPQFAATPGQAAVFYKEDNVIGGGWLRSALH